MLEIWYLLARSSGLVTKSNYWALDEYLGGEIECIDVMLRTRVQAIPSSILFECDAVTKRVINRKWRTDYKPQIGDIVKFSMFGCNDKVGVVLGIEKENKIIQPVKKLKRVA